MAWSIRGYCRPAADESYFSLSSSLCVGKVKADRAISSHHSALIDTPYVDLNTFVAVSTSFVKLTRKRRPGELEWRAQRITRSVIKYPIRFPPLHKPSLWLAEPVAFIEVPLLTITTEHVNGGVGASLLNLLFQNAGTWTTLYPLPLLRNLEASARKSRAVIISSAFLCFHPCGSQISLLNERSRFDTATVLRQV